MQAINERATHAAHAHDALDAVPAAYTDFCASLRAERSWRNVQPVLLASFVSVAHLLTTQALQIQSLRRELARLHNTMEEERDEVARSIDDKIAQVVQPLQQQLADTTNISRHGAIALRALEQAQEHFATKEAAAEQLARLAELDASLRQSIAEQAESWRRHTESQSRDSNATHMQTLERLRAEQQQQLERAQQAIERQLTDQMQRQIADALAAAKHEPPSSAKRESSRRLLDVDDLDRLTREYEELEERLSKRLSSWRRELTVSVSDKPSRSEIAELLSHKLDASIESLKRVSHSALSARLDEVVVKLTDMVTQAQNATADDLAQMRALGSTRASTTDVAQLKQNLHKLLSVVESLQHEASAVRAAMSEKINVDDVRQLIESHATLVGLERAMQQIQCAAGARDAGVTKLELERVEDQVLSIEQQLRSEMYQARYIWKEGRPSAKQTIAWNAQVVNTHADVFVWQNGSDKVMLKIPGLYHLQVAFFTDFSPTIRVLVNGEPGAVLAGDDVADTDSPVSSSNSSRSATAGHQVAVRGARRVHHSAGNIVGLALDAFLALPARAVVQIAYDIDERAQGFLNLRKL